MEITFPKTKMPSQNKLIFQPQCFTVSFSQINIFYVQGQIISFSSKKMDEVGRKGKPGSHLLYTQQSKNLIQHTPGRHSKPE